MDGSSCLKMPMKATEKRTANAMNGLRQLHQLHHLAILELQFESGLFVLTIAIAERTGATSGAICPLEMELPHDTDRCRHP